MPQYTEHATWQLYETYHVPVNVQRDRRTYDHFASAHSRSMRQEQLLTTYMSEMMNAIYQDVHNQGDCWLLSAIVKHELPAIHLLDRSAIACVYATCFTPDETVQADTRTIPYSTQCCATPGGMRYADRRARGFVIDLRADAALHPLCHALIARAALQEHIRSAINTHRDTMALLRQMNELSDALLGQQRENFRLQQELAAARSALSESASAADAPIADPTEPASEAAPAPAAPEALSPAEDGAPTLLP